MKPHTRETLAGNVRYLMENQPGGKWSQTKLGQRAGVAQTTITNILNPEKHSPTLESVEAVAHAFGLEGWHLIMPSLIADLTGDTSIRRIYDAYQQSTPDGRRHIQRVAEREAEYSVSQHPPNGDAA